MKAAIPPIQRSTILRSLQRLSPIHRLAQSRAPPGSAPHRNTTPPRHRQLTTLQARMDTMVRHNQQTRGTTPTPSTRMPFRPLMSFLPYHRRMHSSQQSYPCVKLMSQTSTRKQRTTLAAKSSASSRKHVARLCDIHVGDASMGKTHLSFFLRLFLGKKRELLKVLEESLFLTISI